MSDVFVFNDSLILAILEFFILISVHHMMKKVIKEFNENLDEKLLKSNSESVEFISSASLNSAIPASPMLLSVVFHIKMVVVGWSITCGIHY